MYSKNRRFRVFIIIKNGQTHVFLKDYVHIYQMGSHFVGSYQLDFLPTGQETKTSILQAFSPFFTKICWEKHQICTLTTKNKYAMAIFVFFFFFALIKLPWSTFHVKNAVNLQSRAGWDFWWCATWMREFHKYKWYFVF